MINLEDQSREKRISNCEITIPLDVFMQRDGSNTPHFYDLQVFWTSLD